MTCDVTTQQFTSRVRNQSASFHLCLRLFQTDVHTLSLPSFLSLMSLNATNDPYSTREIFTVSLQVSNYQAHLEIEQYCEATKDVKEMKDTQQIKELDEKYSALMMK